MFFVYIIYHSTLPTKKYSWALFYYECLLTNIPIVYEKSFGTIIPLQTWLQQYDARKSPLDPQLSSSE